MLTKSNRGLSSVQIIEGLQNTFQMEVRNTWLIQLQLEMEVTSSKLQLGEGVKTGH